MRTLRYVVGGAVIAVVVIGAVVLVLAGISALYRFNELVGFGALVAIAGAVIGGVFLDMTREQERLDEFMFTRIDYPTDDGE